jgi:N-glycosylase/DNA lyase
MPLLGLRLLRQDPWEATASFVCSAAANIRKITACVEGIAAQWGEPIPGSTRRAFPGPEVVARAAERDLRSLGLGFRAPYLLESARLIARGDLGSWERLRRVPIAEARAALCDLPGVGPKIADCVLLFGLGRLEAYPVDRWIRRATLELAARRRARDQDLSQWAERLGPSRGYLQQILFHLRRTGGPLPALPSAPRRARSR